MSAFQSALLQISEGLAPDNLDAMVFLCIPVIGKKKLENVKSGIKLFQYLMEMNKIGEDDAEFLRQLLLEVNRLDLICLLDNFEKHRSCHREDQPDPQEQDKLNIAVDVIVEKLGKNWRTYGRRLGMSDAKLDHIMEKHPYNLQEKGYELLKEWRKVHGKEARVKTLIDTLRSCNWNLTADLVERALLQQNTCA